MTIEGITPRTIFDLPTPALLLDRPRLERNAARMRDQVRRLGVTLRPHVKTSKSIEVLKILADGQDVPITVSTLAEARYFFDHGITDIMYAVGIAPVKLPEVAELIRAGCRLRIILDTAEAASAVRSFADAEGVPVEVLIEVDSDGHRAGVAPTDELLIAIGQRLGKSLAGVMTHAGASYDCRTRPEFEAMAEQERDKTLEAAGRLRAAGLRCDIVSVGSTPTLHYGRSLEGVTEGRAGVYAFGDLVQAELGTCSIDDIAIGVLGSVIGHNRHHGRVLIDAGFLALSRDRGTSDLPVDWGYGAVCDPLTGERVAGVTVSSTNQEHGILTASSGEMDFLRFPVGSRVKILPNHACATAAAYERYYVTEGSDEITGTWERVNGW
ncbi:alanine racemase [Sphingomonas agri]|uniref:alanine racemase n=1 Tax=Sphingomonas agri TaxID=1813878 RepID=UPI00311E4BBE